MTGIRQTEMLERKRKNLDKSRMDLKALLGGGKEDRNRRQLGIVAAYGAGSLVTMLVNTHQLNLPMPSI